MRRRSALPEHAPLSTEHGAFQTERQGQERARRTGTERIGPAL
jgi:hypothetical protein